RFGARAAQIHDAPAVEDDARAEHVVGGRPVLQAVYAARVLRDVAADGAAPLARRVRDVVQPVPCNGARDLRVDHARLDDGNSVLNINLEHAAHPRKLYADPAADGE